MDTNPPGQPTKFKEEYIEIAHNYSKLGAIDKELAEYFNVSEDTIYEWKNKHPKFSEAINLGKDIFNTRRVEGALIHSALGFEHPHEEIFQYEGQPIKVQTIKRYPPNAASLIFFLKNRDRNRWKDKQEHEISGNITVNVDLNPRGD